VARRAGREAGRLEVTAGGEPDIEPVLAARGYEPYHDGPSLRLRNCPFANLAGEYPVLVCAMNLSLIEGLLEGIGEPAGRAAMDPAPGRCCVALRDPPQLGTSKDSQN
jgi:predicted ArsR family transcriptional regulator